MKCPVKNPAILDNCGNAFRVTDIAKGVCLNDDEIAKPSFLDRSHLRFQSEKFGRILRRRHDRLHRRQAGIHEKFHLVMQAESGGGCG